MTFPVGGLRPVRTLSGAPATGGLQEFRVLSTYGTALFVGDPVRLVADGISGNDDEALPVVERAGTSGALVGVIVGFKVGPTTNIEIPAQLPANTGGIVIVQTNQDVVYGIRSTAVIAAADFLQNANLSFATAGDTRYGQSGARLDASTLNTTASLQLKILGLRRAAGNSRTSTNPVIEVTINNHQYAPNTAGI